MSSAHQTSLEPAPIIAIGDHTYALLRNLTGGATSVVWQAVQLSGVPAASTSGGTIRMLLLDAEARHYAWSGPAEPLVAIKVARTPDDVAELRAEAEVLVLFRGNSDYVQLLAQATENFPAPCLVLAWADGRQVDELIQATGALDERQATALLFQLANALVSGRRRAPGIIPTDTIKGSSLFWQWDAATGAGALTLADFNRYATADGDFARKTLIRLGALAHLVTTGQEIGLDVVNDTLDLGDVGQKGQAAWQALSLALRVFIVRLCTRDMARGDSRAVAEACRDEIARVNRVWREQVRPAADEPALVQVLLHDAADKAGVAGSPAPEQWLAWCQRLLADVSGHDLVRQTLAGWMLDKAQAWQTTAPAEAVQLAQVACTLVPTLPEPAWVAERQAAQALAEVQSQVEYALAEVQAANRETGLAVFTEVLGALKPVADHPLAQPMYAALQAWHKAAHLAAWDIAPTEVLRLIREGVAALGADQAPGWVQVWRDELTKRVSEHEIYLQQVKQSAENAEAQRHKAEQFARDVEAKATEAATTAQQAQAELEKQQRLSRDLAALRTATTPADLDQLAAVPAADKRQHAQALLLAAVHTDNYVQAKAWWDWLEKHAPESQTTLAHLARPALMAAWERHLLTQAASPEALTGAVQQADSVLHTLTQRVMVSPPPLMPRTAVRDRDPRQLAWYAVLAGPQALKHALATKPRTTLPPLAWVGGLVVLMLLVLSVVSLGLAWDTRQMLAQLTPVATSVADSTPAPDATTSTPTTSAPGVTPPTAVVMLDAPTLAVANVRLEDAGNRAVFTVTLTNPNNQPVPFTLSFSNAFATVCDALNAVEIPANGTQAVCVQVSGTEASQYTPAEVTMTLGWGENQSTTQTLTPPDQPKPTIQAAEQMPLTALSAGLPVTNAVPGNYQVVWVLGDQPVGQPVTVTFAADPATHVAQWPSDLSPQAGRYTVSLHRQFGNMTETTRLVEHPFTAYVLDFGLTFAPPVTTRTAVTRTLHITNTSPVAITPSVTVILTGTQALTLLVDGTELAATTGEMVSSAYDQALQVWQGTYTLSELPLAPGASKSLELVVGGAPQAFALRAEAQAEGVVRTSEVAGSRLTDTGPGGSESYPNWTMLLPSAPKGINTVALEVALPSGVTVNARPVAQKGNGQVRAVQDGQWYRVVVTEPITGTFGINMGSSVTLTPSETYSLPYVVYVQGVPVIRATWAYPPPSRTVETTPTAQPISNNP